MADFALSGIIQPMARRNDTTLSKQLYAALRRDIQKLLQAGATSANKQRVVAYWRIGERIAAERITAEAGYHNSVLRELSRDTGASISTLQRAVSFRETYEKPPSPGLSWSHVKVLLTVDSPAERRHLAKRAEDESLSSRELAALIKNHDKDAATDSALRRPTDASFLYKAEVHSVVDGDTLELDIDLGFHTLRRQRIRLAALNCPELRTEKGKAAKLFVTEQVLAAPFLVVKTNKADIYGRYVAHVFLGKRTSSIESCFQKGIYLNNLLIEKKHARRAI